jgi:hypothetical protein
MRQVAGDNRAAQTEAVFEAVLSRPASADEKHWSEQLLEKQAALYRESTPTASIAEQKALVHLCHTLLNTSEFFYVP